MVGKSKRPKKRPLLGSHQRCWLWGRHLVQETLRAGRWPILELLLADDLPADERQRIEDLAKQASVPFQIVPRAELAKHALREDHQGYAARMPPYPYAAIDDVLAAGSESPLYLVLDAIQDPHNFGAILRSAEVFGFSSVLTGTEGQAEVSSHVARASAGAVNRIPVVRDNLADVLARLKAAGIRILGASEKARLSADGVDLRRASAIVIGNEGQGLRPAVREACDEFLRIPQFGSVSSLNAAAAAAVLCYEARRQRQTPP